MKIFDVGMNHGNLTDTALILYGENLTIVGLEPNPILVDFLKNKYSERHNVTILDMALSDKNEEEIPFYLSAYDWGSSLNSEWINYSRFVECFDKNRYIKVKTITIDSLISIYGIPDILKIDIEGHEYFGMLGLTKKINKICFEFSEEDIYTRKACEYLLSLGYEQFGYIEGDDYLKEPDEYVSYDNLKLFDKFDVNRKKMWGMIWVK